MENILLLIAAIIIVREFATKILMRFASNSRKYDIYTKSIKILQEKLTGLERGLPRMKNIPPPPPIRDRIENNIYDFDLQLDIFTGGGIVGESVTEVTAKFILSINEIKRIIDNEISVIYLRGKYFKIIAYNLQPYGLSELKLKLVKKPNLA